MVHVFPRTDVERAREPSGVRSITEERCKASMAGHDVQVQVFNAQRSFYDQLS